MGFIDRLQHGWNAFMNRDPPGTWTNIGSGDYRRPGRVRLTRGNERSIINAVYNRIALDCSAIRIEHVRLDEDKRYKETINSPLNDCLNTEANLDESSRFFIQNIILSMFDEGYVAVVPTETNNSPFITGSYEIYSMRVGKIVEWFPQHIKVHLYNEKTGKSEDIVVPKKIAAIIENPFYSVMNEPSSTMQRLIRKLNLLDVIDEESGAGKLDLIVQLPYTVKTELRKKQAEERQKDIERQLSGSKYGIAYIDATEHVTQLNRSVDNNLMHQVEYLTNLMFSQLGITTGILDGSASESEMTNYTHRIVEVILSTIVEEMRRKFLTKTARSRLESVMYFIDPFQFVPISSMPDAADKYRRNEIMSANEIRQKLGLKADNDPKSDALNNPNIGNKNEGEVPNSENEEPQEEYSDGLSDSY